MFTVYSFHPNKNMTTGEGGAIACHDDRYVGRIKRLRFHGIERDAWKRFQKEGSPHFEVMEPARKANFMDLQAAMGLHQLQEAGRLQRPAQAAVPALPGTAWRTWRK